MTSNADEMAIRPGSDFTMEQLSECSNAAFADYFGHPIVWTPAELAAYLPAHGVSLSRSLVAADERGAPVGFALMAHRDDLPGHARLLAAVVDAARADGTETVWLEVITENAPAVKLYSRGGFEVVRPLAGWKRGAEQPEEEQQRAEVRLEECKPEEVLERLRRHGAEADLPWQLWHQFLLATRPQSCRGFRLVGGSAYCAISDPEDESRDAISLLGLAVEPEARGRGEATALLRAVLAKYPGKKWKAPATIPLAYGERIARRLGFEKESITMNLMKLRLE
ncbi:acetyltransferase, gnat family [Cordyceps fumosorosea ARSEF 2679]|uniref:Acetyltransferase, gnat family n=1 Tax=Cordyceps fumosorosea (strain ARSEF 2679) TaxID=1081104 RepID=A0A167VXK1_CORFA|nr:acetyltransferase, gnat family [Cordyceps fumosorosea ARSEF 2679]OAA63091.1 acetyltransferase, gnat family [Cordyceps fumosorosea ARSEF 2679]